MFENKKYREVYLSLVQTAQITRRHRLGSLRWFACQNVIVRVSFTIQLKVLNLLNNYSRIFP